MAERKHLLHVKSSQLNGESNGPKLPTADQIEYGELAVNYANGHETISLKNSDNQVVTFSSDNKNEQKFASKERVAEIDEVTSKSFDTINQSCGFNEKMAYEPKHTLIQGSTSLADAIEKVAEKAIQGGGGSGSGVGMVDANSDGTGEIFNNYDGVDLNISKGNSSHAEGKKTQANSNGSHAEGIETIAGDSTNPENGKGAHAEGYQTLAIGNYAHAEGGGAVPVSASFYTKTNDEIVNEWKRLYITPTIYETGDGFSMAKGKGSHSEGKNTLALGDYSHAGGFATVATGEGSFAQGCSIYRENSTDGSITRYISYISATGKGAVAMGAVTVYGTSGGIIASGTGSVAMGCDTKSSGIGSIAMGNNTKASGNGSVAMGNGAKASGYNSIAIGVSDTIASGRYSHAEGEDITASGDFSHAEGRLIVADGIFSYARGSGTIANNFAQTSIGQYNSEDSNPSKTSYYSQKPAFVIGNGTNDFSRGDAFKVLFNGNTFADGAYSGSGADYAEMFEWNDGNINNEDRVGLFVSLDCDKIKIAKSTDSNIIGIISGNPSIIGDNPMRWNNKYLTDEWGRTIIEDVEVKYFEDEEYIDENNIKSIRKVEKIRIDRIPKLNPDYNNELDYLLRTERKEWDAVGLLGKLLVRQDGTLKVGGYCKSNDNGIATEAESGYYVMKVISESQALIIFK